MTAQITFEAMVAVIVGLSLLLFLRSSTSVLDAAALFSYFVGVQVLGPAVLIAAGLIEYPYYLHGYDFARLNASFAVVLGLFFLSVLCGLWIFSPYQRLGRSVLPHVKLADCSRKSVALLALFLTAIGVVTSVGLLFQVGSPSALLEGLRGGELLSGHLYLRLAYVVPVYFSAVYLAHFVILRNSGKETSLWLPLITFFLNLSVVSLSGDRDLLLGPILIVLFAYHMGVKRRGIIALGIMGVVAILALSLMADLRQHVRSGDVAVGADMEVSGGVAASLVRQVGESNPYSVSLLRSAESDWIVGQEGMNDYLLGLVSVIPRSIWEDKPKMLRSGARIKKEVQGQDYSGGGWPLLPPVLALENGGIVAVLLMGAITGALLALMQGAYADHLRNPFSLMMLILLTMKVSGGGVRDSLFVNFVIFVLPFYLIAAALHALAWRRAWLGLDRVQ